VITQPISVTFNAAGRCYSRRARRMVFQESKSRPCSFDAPRVESA
jgi:hypothetical protein